jgi:hypothetical protein
MFCRIYVTCKNINQKSLLIDVCNLLHAELANDAYIEKNGFSIDVRRNQDYDEKKGKYFRDGFLYFPFCIKIDILDGISKIEAAQEVSIILKFLWEKNHTAIASCDFEELLPESGGYKRKSSPWTRE